MPIFATTEWIIVALSVRDDYVPPEPPPEPVPEEVSRRQAKRALSDAGLLAAANEAIATMPGKAGDDARIDWADAGTFRRDNPLILGIGERLASRRQAIDDLFRHAVTI